MTSRGPVIPGGSNNVSGAYAGFFSCILQAIHCFGCVHCPSPCGGAAAASGGCGLSGFPPFYRTSGRAVRAPTPTLPNSTPKQITAQTTE
jgi:hypothetical protein